MIEKGKTYTAQELKDLLGEDNWKETAFGVLVELPANKPIINNFSEFDTDTKNIYTQIYNILKKYNDKEFKAWATGSRVKGTWRTAAEANTLSQQYGKLIKHSDYDFFTDALNIPGRFIFERQMPGYEIDFNGANGHRVLIEPEE